MHTIRKGVQAANQTLNVELRQTGNDDYDRYNFLRAMRIMVEYPGDDQVVMQLGDNPVEITTLKVDHRSAEMSEPSESYPGTRRLNKTKRWQREHKRPA